MSNEIKIKIESTSPVADPVNLKTVKYDNLTGKPKINGVELVGDKSTADLKIDVDTSKFATKDELNGKADKTEIPDVSGKADKSTTLSGYGITDAYTKAETDAKIGAVYHVKGSVATYDDLPENPTVGDVYNMQDTGANYVWTGTDWDKLSETVDLSGYATKGDLESKQNKLTAGTGITIEGDTISADGGGAVLPDQTGNAGKFLQTNGESIAWSAGRILYKSGNAYDAPSLIISDAFNDLSLSAGNLGTLIIGGSLYGQPSNSKYNTAVGINAYAYENCTAFGYRARASGSFTIQLGNGLNSDNNTFKVANGNGNFEMMDADGNVPLDRLTYVTNQIGDISTALTAILGE